MAAVLLALLLTAGVVAFGYPCETAPFNTYPYCNPALSSTERAADLVSRMTNEEKIAQLLTGAAEINSLNVPKYNYWNEGLHGVLNINTTSFPEPIGLGASFNMTLIEMIGIVISTEARAIYNMGFKSSFLPIDGLTFFAPNINIFRDPRWGRGQETPGEDPFLTSQYAINYIKGMQGSPLDPFFDSNVRKTTACAKHAFAYSLDNWEGITRYDFNAIIQPIDLFETYFPAFQSAVIDGHVQTVMCSYNSINGTPSCAHNDLFNTMLRNQWGFDGYVVSDCDAIANIQTTHHYSNTSAQAAADGLNAGVDLDCYYYYTFLSESLSQNLINTTTLDTSVQRVMTQRFALGMFDDPANNSYFAIGPDQISSAQHTELARQAARESIVLLKNNNNLLPLNPKIYQKIAVIGPNSNNDVMLLGNYHGFPMNVVTPLQGLINTGLDITYVEGCTMNDDNDFQFNDAIQAAKNADVAILFLGLDQTQEREMHDRTVLTLPGLQLNLTQSIMNTGKPVVVVMLNGGPVDISWIKDNVDSILNAWYPGEQAGNAIADVLFGDYNPGGRLPYTVYPYNYINEINMTNMNMRDPPGRGYRFYTGTPVFEFGEGLSYTTFSYSNATLNEQQFETDSSSSSSSSPSSSSSSSSSSMKMIYSEMIKQETNFTINVTNTGNLSGSDVVLAFITNENENKDYISTPIKQLFGFSKVFLQPQESIVVSFPFPSSTMTQFTDLSATRGVICSGWYRITIGVGENMMTHRFFLAHSQQQHQQQQHQQECVDVDFHL